MTEQTERAEVEARILEGRAKHGVGMSEDFPGNVCHLVSPIVGSLRLRQRDGSPVADIGWIIDRLSLVLDMARWETDHGEAAAEARGAERALREAADEITAALFDVAKYSHARGSRAAGLEQAHLIVSAARAAARGVEGGAR